MIYGTVGIPPSPNLTFFGPTPENGPKPYFWDAKRSTKTVDGAVKGTLPGNEMYHFGTLVTRLGEDTAQGKLMGS
jgi:hypothetical protein